MTTRPGDVIVFDPTAQFMGEATSRYDLEAWLLPRRLFEPHKPVSLRLRALVLSGESGLSRLVKTYLDGFAAQLGSLGDREAEIVADNFLRLLAVACGANAGDHRESIRLARLEEAKRHINLNLANPKLTPETVASALRVSVRQLHLLFEPSGMSFSQYVLGRRLEECRAAVAAGERAFADIAFGWGFGSLTTFHRNFRAAFGQTPGELRQGARQQD